MEIAYQTNSYVFHPFYLAFRHLQVAFSSGESKAVQSLWDKGVVAYVGKGSTPSLLGRVKHIFFAVADGISGVIPGVGFVIAFFDRLLNGYKSLPPNMDEKAQTAVTATPKFASYGFSKDPSVHLTNLSLRPANLLYEAIFGTDPTTQPGSGELLAFPKGTSFSYLFDATLTATAKGKKADLYRPGKKDRECEVDLEHFLGDKTFEISRSEIKGMHDSQQVFVSPLIPKEFYLGVKQALKHDGMIILPASDTNVPTLGEIIQADYPSRYFSVSPSISNRDLFWVGQFLKKVEQNPSKYGFVNNETMLTFAQLKSLTLYQLGSMIVKAEDYRSLVGGGYRIRERQVGDNDAIRLISASGIRGFHSTTSIPGNDRHQVDTQIMKQTFKAALKAAGPGSDVVFPAVGMGVWGGHPEVYWKAFLDAIVEGGDEIEWIYVNPGHQKTHGGAWKGYMGQEFEILLQEHRRKHPQNANLRKVVNLYDRQTDLFLLAQNLKKQQPEKTVALFNASDPDVTLGNHVGEYVNNLCHPSTTEENFAAAGTSGLGFEEFTGVLGNHRRVIQT